MSLRVGVIGAGNMGADHARTLATAISDARVVAVTDADPARAEAVAAGIDGCRAVTKPDALIAEVDAVLVASPDDTHESYVLACLTAGTPVLCEKPLATTVEAGERLLAAEVAIGRRLVQVGFMRRYDPGYVALKRAIDAGDLGPPLLAHCVHRNASALPRFRTEALLTSSAEHEFDIVRWLFGTEIVAVTVYRPRSSGLAAPGVSDPLFVLLRTADDVLVDVEVFVNARYGYDVRCEVVGELGAASLPEPTPLLVRRDGARRVSVAPDWRERFADAYRIELQAWVDAVRAGAARGPSAWDGYAAAVVAQAGVESLHSGATVEVVLPPPPDLYVIPQG